MIKETKRTKITDEIVKSFLIDMCGWTEEVILQDDVYYRSPCKRYTLTKTKYCNLFDPETGFGWDLHVDNSDMQSLASGNVEYIDQLAAFMEIYGQY